MKVLAGVGAGAGACAITGGSHLDPCIKHPTVCGREKPGRKPNEPPGGVVRWKVVVRCLFVVLAW